MQRKKVLVVNRSICSKRNTKDSVALDRLRMGKGSQR